jgi:hypothetical protein
MMPKRSCGSCTLCCKLLPMSKHDPYRKLDVMSKMIEHGMARPEQFTGMTPEWDKPAGERCEHQSHSKGCKIYDRRPFGCRFWNCRWLLGDDTGGRPDRVGYVVDVMPDFITVADGGESLNVEVIQVWVDPARPDAHHDTSLRLYLNEQGKSGKACLLRYGSRMAVSLWPPSMTGAEWIEKRGSVTPEERGPEERVRGILSAQGRLIREMIKS